VSTRVDTVGLVEQTSRLAIAPSPQLDPESRRWLDTLRAVDPATRDQAVAALHALLLRAARFELSRRRAALSHLHGDELDDVATQAADDALVSVLRRLDDFRGASRFTTWAYKFALYEAAVSAGPAPHAEAEQRELVAALQAAIETVLTPHQRRVLVALAVNGVPIDVLAERLGTNRGALYKTVHDARRKLRRELAVQGLEPTEER
jgi:RNA polymerase sigma-70 factor (ECF subfamily)